MAVAGLGVPSRLAVGYAFACALQLGGGPASSLRPQAAVIGPP